MFIVELLDGNKLPIPKKYIDALKVTTEGSFVCYLEDNIIYLIPSHQIKESFSKKNSLDKLNAKKIWYFSCFSNFSISLNDERICINNKKARELLAYLLTQKGVPTKKTKIAEVLWNDCTAKSMDSLYKVCRYIKKWKFDKYTLPLIDEGGLLYLDMRAIESDLYEFDYLYKFKNDLSMYEKAIQLYKGSFLLDEAYEWAYQIEGYYDIRYLEMMEFVIQFYSSKKITQKCPITQNC